METKQESIKTFDTFKEYLVSAGKEKQACAEEYRKLLKSSDFAELFDVIKSNLNWCYSREIINSEILLKYVNIEDLNAQCFYVKQSVAELKGNEKVWLIDSKVSVMRENSQVSEMRENSQVSEMWENSQVSVMRENSQVSEMWGNSQVSAMWGTSTRKEFKGNKPKLYFKKDAFEIVLID